MKNIYCWKCLDKGKLTGFPLYKVKNSWVFACKEHKDDSVPDIATSELRSINEEVNHN